MVRLLQNNLSFVSCSFGANTMASTKISRPSQCFLRTSKVDCISETVDTSQGIAMLKPYSAVNFSTGGFSPFVLIGEY